MASKQHVLLIIGSSAFKIRAPQLLERSPQDLDLIVGEEHLNQVINGILESHENYQVTRKKNKVTIFTDRIVEIEVATPGSSGEALLSLHADPTPVATLDEIYTIKMSHRYLKNSPHFDKTRRQILALRKEGAKVFSDTWLKMREKETYFYEHPNLDRNKENFFDSDGVDYKYDHDSIHEAIALYNRPAYTLYQVDDKEVLSSKAKFNKLSMSMRLSGVVEEACVLAIERSLVPFPGKKTPEEAFLYALEKVCTSITSGWFREFAWEHFDSAINLFERNYYNYYFKFLKGIRQGTVKPFRK